MGMRNWVSKKERAATYNMFNGFSDKVKYVGSKMYSKFVERVKEARKQTRQSFNTLSQPVGDFTMLEQLEPRVLLAAQAGLGANDAVVTDGAGGAPDDANVTIIGSTTNTTVDITFSDNGAGVEDTITAITINDPGAGAANNVIVAISTTGSFAPGATITYNGSAGDTISLSIFIETITDTGAGGYGDVLTGGTSGITAGSTAGGAITDDTAATPQSDGDAMTAGAGDDIGVVSIDTDTVLVASTINNTAAGGNIGALTFSGGAALTGAVTVSPGTDATVAGFTITGTTVLNNLGLTVTTADDTSGGGEETGGAVSISAASTITAAGSGDIAINTTNDADQGAVTLGAYTNSSTSGSTVTIAPNGTGNFTGAVAIGAVTMTGSTVSNAFTLGDADSDFTTLTLAGVNNSDGLAASDFNVLGGAITTLALGSSTYATDDDGGISINVVSTGSITGTAALTIAAGAPATADISIDVEDTTGAVSLGALTNNSSLDADISILLNSDSTAAENVTSLTLGAVTIGGAAGAQVGNDIIVTVGDSVTGAVTVGNIAVGDTGDGDTGDFSIQQAAANNGLFGSLTLGTVATDGTGGATVSVFTNAGTGTIGGVTVGNVTVAGTGANPVAIGHLGGATAAGNLGALTLNDISNTSTNAASDVSFLASIIGNVTVNSTWDINGAGDIIITADSGVGAAATGTLGTFNGAALDLNFAAGGGTTGRLRISAAEGTSGPISFNTIDHLGTTGGVVINVDSDGDGTGAIGGTGAFTIAAIGNDTTNTIAWATASSLAAEQGGVLTIAESVANGGSFTAASGLATAGHDDDGWGNVVIGLAANALTTFFDGTLAAEDGIGTLTVNGRVGVNAAATITANTDTATETSLATAGVVVAGALGNVSITGVAGGTSLSAGTITATDFGSFTITAGNWASTNLTTNITDGVGTLRNTTTSDVGGITITNGNISGVNSLTLDDGFTAATGVTVSALTPTLGDATFATITLDADGALTGATRAGGLPNGITTSGALTITTLDSDAANEAVGSTTDIAANDIGAIQSGEALLIGTLDVGGDIPSITIVEATGAAAAQTLTVTTLNVNGDVNSITSGGAAGDTVTTAGFIAGDLDTISAGTAAFVSAGLRVLGGTATSPVSVFTDFGVDYILAVDGTFTAGTLDFTTVFPADAGTAGSRSEADGDEPNLLINDITGTTSIADSALIVATRLTGTPHTAVDDSGAEWDVIGINDLNAGQHDWFVIRVEGDARTADWGADSNAFDGSSSAENIIGDVANVELQGVFDNAGGVDMFFLSLGEISFAGTTGGALTQDIANGSSVPVVTNTNNSDGAVSDLEIYTPLAAITATDVLITVPTASAITKLFVGPTNVFESITLTNNDAAILGNFVLDLAGGILGDIHLFGENLGIEFNTVDPATPATSSNTNIFYGDGDTTAGGAVEQTATEPSAAGQNAIDFLEFNSVIGNVTVTDILTTNAIAAILGPVIIGYVVTIDSASNIGAGVNAWIEDPNDGSSNGTLVVKGSGAAGAALFPAGAGNFSVDGTFSGLLSSGTVGNVTTVDTITEATPVPSANFTGLVVDGSAGTITVGGSVTNSLVVGDPQTTALGANNALLGGDDTTGITGTPAFGGAITVGGSLGTTPTNVGTGGDMATVGQAFQLPTAAASANGLAAGNNLGAGFVGDQVGTPDGLAVSITVGEVLDAAIISGKRIIIDSTEAQDDDDITGTIQASEIRGDIWSGDDITATSITATGLGATLGTGVISSSGANASIDVTATGASAGDITTDIFAAGNVNNLLVDAGSGTGGSQTASIVAGTDGTGSFTGTNNVTADQNIGTAAGGDIFSAAQDVLFNLVEAGLQTAITAGVAVTAGQLGGGDVNVDFAAGLPFIAGVAQTVPIGAPTSTFTTNLNEANLPNFQSGDDTIAITTLRAGNVDTRVDGVLLNDRDSDLTGTLAAASSITVTTLTLDGDAIGNDGVPGGHVAAAGLGNLGATFGAPSALTIAGGAVTGNLAGTFSSGMFVPFDNSGASPLNVNDLGTLQAGTVLALGSASITLTVGTWNQSSTGVNGTDGINLSELMAGSESGTNAAFAPNFSVGVTHDAAVNVTVVGLPFSGSQTGPGSTAPDPATGDATDVSIAAFGQVTGTTTVRDTADFNFVMSNIDAVTAIDTSGVAGGDPSNPSTTTPLNAGAAGGGIGANLTLSITSNGNGAGGLDVEYFLAGYDYFVNTNTSGAVPTASDAPANSVATAPKTPGFFESFGAGDISGSLTAQDADPTNGLEVGDLSFALVAAGDDITGNLIAQDDIIARTGSADKDGSTLIPGGKDADVLAGANINNSISPFGLASLFNGGFINNSIVAGDDIGSTDADGLISIAAQGDNTGGGGVGLTSGDVQVNLVSGAEDQLAGSDLFDDFGGFAGTETEQDGVLTEDGNLAAFVVAAGDVQGTIDAGDTQQAFGGTTGGGLGGASGLAGGTFTGGIHAGAGPDLDISAIDDNDFAAYISANIRTENNLNVEDMTGMTLGILSETSITGVIEVGYNINGGDLLGNVVAEDNIAEIEVWGDVGATGTNSAIYAGGTITNFAVGDASGATGFNNLRPDAVYINSFGDVYADVYAGGVGTAGELSLYVGNRIQTGGSLLAGVNQGFGGLNFQWGGFLTEWNFTGGNNLGVWSVQGGAAGALRPDVYAYDTTNISGGTTGDPGNLITLTVVGDGTEAGMGQFVAVDGLAALHVIDGSVDSIEVNDDFDITTELNNDLATLDIPLSAFPNLTNSLNTVRQIEHAVNNDKQQIDAAIINVDFNIGTTGASGTGIADGSGVRAGFNTAMSNFAVSIQGDLETSITSETGSIGNIMTGLGIGTSDVLANISIGDVFVGTGSLDGNNVFTARSGSMGVLSAEEDIDDVSFDISQNLGGIIARTGFLDASSNNVDVNGSIGLLQASGSVTGTYTAETGTLGIDLEATDKFDLVNNAGVHSNVGKIEARFIAGSDIGNITASLGNIEGGGSNPDIITGGNLGILTAGNDISDGVNIQVAGNAAGIVAGDDIEEFKIDVAGDLGDVTAGSNINKSSGTVVFEANAVGNIDAVNGSIGSSTTVNSDTSIGNVTASGNIEGTYVAQTSTIGGYQSDEGDIDVTATAGLAIGDITAGGSILGDYTSINASIGNLTALTGSIGAKPTTISALEIVFVNTGTDIFTVAGNVTAQFPVGATFTVVGSEESGNVENNGTFTVTSISTSNNLTLIGVANIPDGDADGAIIPSISAPTPVTLQANGGVVLDPFSLEFEHTINGTVLDGVGTLFAPLNDIYAMINTGGSVGALQGASGTATQVAGGISAPLGVVDVTLMVGGHVGGISGGKGVTINDGSLVLGSIGIIRNLESGSFSVEGVDANNPLIVIADGVDYRVSVDSGTAAVAYTASAASVGFDSIDYTPASGSTSGLYVQTTTGGRNAAGTFDDSPVATSLADVVIHGNLDALTVEGTLGNVLVDGDVNVGATILVEDGQWDSWETGGVNNGLSVVTLSKASKTTSFANTLNEDGVASSGDETINLYLKNGTADVTINNGYVENITVRGGSARDLVAVSTQSTLSEAQFKDMLKAVRKRQANSLFDNDPDAANVGTIIGDGTKALKLTGVYVEGDVKNLDGSTVKSKIKNVGVSGDVTRLFASNGVSNVDIRGNAWLIDGGTSLNKIDINGDVDIIKATKSVKNVQITGNAAIVSAGSLLSKVFVGGSSVSVGAKTMKNVQIVGSVGASVDTNGNVSLGNAFTAKKLASVLGVALSDLLSVGDEGPGSDLFYGGLQAHTARNVSVGGAISDLILTGKNNNSDSLFNSALDDAHVKMFSRKATFFKQDGVVTVIPFNSLKNNSSLSSLS